MAKKNLSGMLVLNQISTDGGSTWKTIVCEDTSTINGSSASTEKKTKCQSFTTTSNNATVANGSGVAVTDHEPEEITYQEMQQIRDSLQTILFRRMNAAEPARGILAGEVTFAQFEALITEVTETSATEESITFTWSLSSSGDVDWDNES